MRVTGLWGRAAVPAAGILLLAVLIDGFLIEPGRLVPRSTTVACERLRHGPLRIALFSDVDFLSTDRRERALREAVAGFRPDAVLVAGDLLERDWATHDPAVLQEADDWLRSLPAPGLRFLAPGEEESGAMSSLRDAWSGSIAVLSNESRRFDVGGDTIDLFVARPEAEPAPWSIGREDSRSFLFMRARGHDQVVTYLGEGAPGWRSVFITFAFQTLDAGSGPDFRFAWEGGTGPWGGDGLRLVATPYHPMVTLQSHLKVPHRLLGNRTAPFEPPVDVWCRARIELRDEDGGTRVRARLWKESEQEPQGWPIDAIDVRPSRDWHGTVAFAGHSGRCRYADLRVTDPAGRVLLEEGFRDTDRLRGLWGYTSALADWVFAKDASEASARLVLTHNPDLVLELADLGGPPPDLVLAGHTHGGQFRLPGLGALTTSTAIGRRYDHGLFDFQGIPLYITAGVGTTYVPVRFFDPPEVTLLTLVPSSGRPTSSHGE